MSVYHCDDCRFLHSQCKCPDIGPPWYTAYTHEENMRMREECGSSSWVTSHGLARLHGCGRPATTGSSSPDAG